jgi:arsenate reductase (thioredoxin)
MKRILIICNTNSILSQIAEVFLTHLTFNRVEVFSAGLVPKNINPLAVKVMKELGIDISLNRSKSVNEFYNERFDFLITLQDDAREKSPIFQGSHTKIHKSLDDPGQIKGSDSQKLESYRKSRDQIKDWVTDFIERYQLV